MCGANTRRFFIDCQEDDTDTPTGVRCSACGMEVTFEDWSREIAWKATLMKWLHCKLTVAKTELSP